MFQFLSTRFSKSDVIAEYAIEPAQAVSFQDACRHVAAASIGVSPEAFVRGDAPAVVSLDKGGQVALIRYPADLFEPGNADQISHSLTGHLQLPSVKRATLLDMQFPRTLVKSFPGSRFGVKGIRKLIGTNQALLEASLLQGSSYEFSMNAYEAWTGMDIVADAPSLTNLPSNRFKERVFQTHRRKKKAEQLNGGHKMYMPNVTGSETVKRADFAHTLGCEAVVLNLSGFSSLQNLREADVPVAIQLQRSVRMPHMSSHACAKLCRLAGADIVHIGSLPGPMNADASVHVHDVIDKRLIEERSLAKPWHGVKSSMGLACRVGASHIPGLVQRLGNDLVIQFTDAVSGHSHGVRKGAMACRQALDSHLHHIPLQVYGLKHSELRESLASLQPRF